MSFKCYIAGPVNGTKFSESSARNAFIASTLHDVGMLGLDPLDFEGSHHLLEEEDELDHKAEQMGLISKNSIVENCLNLIDNADVMLMDLRGLKASGVQTWGTPAEMMYAIGIRRIPVVAIVDDYTSAWIEHFCTLTSTLEEALAVLEELQTAASYV